MSKNNNVGSLSLSTTVVTRFLSLCAVLLALPAVAVAQPVPLSPGWYSHSGPSIIYEDSSGLRIVWKKPYVYPYPGNVPLYWYAQVKYLNIGSQILNITCSDREDPSLAKEHMRGTANSSYVAADETFCSRNPNFTGSIEPGGVHYEWAIFHNVPSEGEVSLEWGPYGFSPLVDPWDQHLSNVQLPAECPLELVTLGTCQPSAIAKRTGSYHPGWRSLGDNTWMTADAQVGTTELGSSSAYINYIWVGVNALGGHCTAAAEIKTRIYDGNTLKWSNNNSLDWPWPSLVGSPQELYAYRPSDPNRRVRVSRGGSSRVEVKVDGILFRVNSSGCSNPDGLWGTTTFVIYIK